MPEPNGDGNIPLGQILRELAIDVDTRSDVDDLAPTAGRVATDADGAERGDTYVGNGNQWVDVDHAAGMDVAGLPGLNVVRSTDDLPDPDENGVRQLEDNTAYLFADFILDEYGLELGQQTPLIGWHGGSSGYIHTDGGTAIRGNDVPMFMRNLYVHAPGGTLFDASGSITTEHLVESCAFSDQNGMFGNMASLGTLDGFRVVSFKGCSFGDFDEGLTLSGTSQKAFFSGCPFRRIDEPGVTCIQTDETFETEILKVSGDCYFKDLEPDTEGVRVHPDATITAYFKYINVDHDATVDVERVINGKVGTEKVGTIVRNSFPLADSSVSGEAALLTQTTITGSGDAPTRVASPNWNLRLGERVSLVDNGRVQYDALYDSDLRVEAVVTATGANTEWELSVAENGSPPAERSKVNGVIQGSGGLNTLRSPITFQDISSGSGDSFSPFIKNIGGTADLDVVRATLEVTEV